MHNQFVKACKCHNPASGTTQISDRNAGKLKRIHET